MTINTATDITGDDAAHQIASASKQCRRLWLCATGGKARFGDANVSSTRGVELPQDIEVMFSASDSDPTDTIQLDQCYAYVPMSTTLTISWGS
jgi:hypothetical protein